MPVCALSNCKRRFKKEDGVTYFRFPQPTHEIRKEWVKFIRRNREDPHWNPGQHSSICSLHFRREDTYISKRGQRFLKENAVPCDNIDKIKIERVSSETKFGNTGLQNASVMDDLNQSTIDHPITEMRNQQTNVIADILKNIIYSLDLLIKSDPDSTRSGSVRDKVIKDLFPYQDFIDGINRTSYEEVDILDIGNILKEIDLVYNINEKSVFKNYDLSYNDDTYNDDISYSGCGDSIEDKIMANLRKKEADLVKGLTGALLKRKRTSEISEYLKKKRKESAVNKSSDAVDVSKESDSLFKDGNKLIKIDAIYNDVQEKKSYFFINNSIDNQINNQTILKKDEVKNTKQINEKRKAELVNKKPVLKLKPVHSVGKSVAKITPPSKVDTTNTNDNHLENSIIFIYNDENSQGSNLINNVQVDNNIQQFFSNILMNKEDSTKNMKEINVSKKLSSKKRKPVEDVVVSKSCETEKEDGEIVPEDDSVVLLVMAEDDHDIVSPVPRFVCDYCDITLTSEHYLNTHKMICKWRNNFYDKSSVEEYWRNSMCPLCDLLCKDKKNLRRHYTTHKVKDIETAFRPLKSKEVNPADPERNMKLLNDFVVEFEKSRNSGSASTSVELDGRIESTGTSDGTSSHKEPSIDDYVKFHFKKIVFDADIDKELYCVPCELTFNTKDEINEHRKKLNNLDTIVCNHCDRTFDAASKLTSHVKCHRGKYNPKSLYLHLKPEDSEGSPRQFDYKFYACKYCLAMFTQNTSFVTHMNYYKREGKCLTIRGARKRTLPPEIRRTADGKLQCNICNKTRRILTAMMEHLATHSDMVEYYCECGKGFKTQIRLRNHINVVHSGNFTEMCEVCGLCVSYGNLTRHMKIHSDLKPFQCDYCNNTFKYKEALTSHIRTHTGERPWKCQYCEMAFSEKRTYNTHMNIHEGRTPYQCSLCPSAFVSKLKLNTHFAEHNTYYNK